jgi:GTP pyrophosphokinase
MGGKDDSHSNFLYYKVILWLTQDLCQEDEMLAPSKNAPPPLAATLLSLPADFSPRDRELLQEVAEQALKHVQHDPDSTVSPQMVQQVFHTLRAADCDAKTILIFFLSLLSQDDLAEWKPRLEPDLIEAAHTVSVIRLLRVTDRPSQWPIRKVLLRQLVLKVTHDVRVMIVKIAGRLVVLRNADSWGDQEKQFLAQEALEVVVPWCDALGLDEWRQELQELSFKYLSPDQYNFIISLMQDHRDVLFEVKDQVIRELRELVQRHAIEANVQGRVKTHYAVYRKMQAYELKYDEVWDRIGIRILTRDVFSCYYVQMAIEEELYNKRLRYDDWIAKPRKPYNYQSIHMTVAGPRNIAVEIQIRSYDMHIKGEYGVAAHWKMYGGGEGALSTEDTKFAFLRTQAYQLLGDPLDYLGNTLDALLFNNSILPTDTAGYLLDPESGDRLQDSQGAEIHYREAQVNEKGYVVDSKTNELILSQSGEPIWHQSEILPDRVIVYTPTGDLKSLPIGATPLDFAYYIHQNVGDTCIGARVNGKMQKLDYTLQMGDVVEITTRHGNKPSLDWLYNGYARTRRAQGKIRRYFREKSDSDVPVVEDIGHAIIKKRLSAHKIRDIPLQELAERMKFKAQGEFLEAVGSGEVSIPKLDDVLVEMLLQQLSVQNPPPPVNHSLHLSQREFELLHTQAQCCLPLPGDETYSYISQGKGFTLHRAECRNVSTLDPERLGEFDWPEYLLCEDGQKPPPVFLSKLMISAVHPTKTILFIKDMTMAENLPIVNIQTASDQQMGTTLISLSFRAACKPQLDRLIRKLNASDDIVVILRPKG